MINFCIEPTLSLLLIAITIPKKVLFREITLLKIILIDFFLLKNCKISRTTRRNKNCERLRLIHENFAIRERKTEKQQGEISDILVTIGPYFLTSSFARNDSHLCSISIQPPPQRRLFFRPNNKSESQTM